MARVLLFLIEVYRLAVRPLLPRACRFEPSCSEFAAEAVRRRGAVHGARVALGRLLRCHPWHAGGYDPVPAEER